MVHWGRNLPFFGSIKAITHNAVNPNATVDPMTVNGLQQLHDFWNALTDTTVLVWQPADGVGHAAMLIGSSAGRGINSTDYYVSWFPAVQPTASLVLPGEMVVGAAHGFYADCEAEGNGQARLPEYFRTIPGLNTVHMLAAWERIKTKQGAHYRVMRKNCSTIVARVLRAGLTGWQHFLALRAAHKLWWTPYDVQVFADNI
ncbi:MAG TPA: hypothetical protein VMG10_29255 [Gemmataceae bacterium]|nr:hypothetical protein [Gemmataceae bacterium]